MTWRRSLMTVMALLAVRCDGGKTEPLDGGDPLQFVDDPAATAFMAKDPCWRREKGGWHGSIAHCREMTSPHRITGVWITAFEETSFLAGESRSPDPNDIRRYEDSIELDPAKAIRMAGRPPSDANGESYLLNFVGRRTRDPVHVDCLGIASFGFVVDRLLSAKYLGPMGPLDLEALKAQPHPATVAHRHGGVWGRLEAAAVKSCAPHGRG